MPSSSYYREMHRRRERDMKRYKDDLEDLEKVLYNLEDKMDDEIRKVNQGIEGLQEDLKVGIRHNSFFTSQANQIATRKETGVSADRELRQAIDDLESVKSRLRGNVNDAQNDSERYKKQYAAKKAEERQQFLDKIF